MQINPYLMAGSILHPLLVSLHEWGTIVLPRFLVYNYYILHFVLSIICLKIIEQWTTDNLAAKKCHFNLDWNVLRPFERFLIRYYIHYCLHTFRYIIGMVIDLIFLPNLRRIWLLVHVERTNVPLYNTWQRRTLKIYGWRSSFHRSPFDI